VAAVPRDSRIELVRQVPDQHATGVLDIAVEIAQRLIAIGPCHVEGPGAGTLAVVDAELGRTDVFGVGDADGRHRGAPELARPSAAKMTRRASSGSAASRSRT